MKHNKVYVYLKEFLKDNLVNIIIIVVGLFLCFYKTDYLVYRPGGAMDLASMITVDNDNEISGSYSMSYVSVAQGSLINVLCSYIIKDWDLVKQEEATYEDMDYETSYKIDRLLYLNSIDLSTYVAYTAAGKDIEITKEDVTVSYIDENAKTDIELLDNIKEINGKSFNTLDEIRVYINTLEIGDEVEIKVIDKDGNTQTRHATIYESEGSKIIGVLLFVDYDFETDPEITINSGSTESGSSGGFMMTLAIYDYLTEEDLANGKNIMGTGTIDVDGNVGEIGGIKYKLLGAKKNDADIFFVPEANYKEAKKIYDEYNLKFELVSIANFNDAIEYLNSNNK